MNLEKYLKSLKELIDKSLDRYLPKESVEPKAIHKAMRYSVFSGGKRLRPILVIESARVCGPKQKDAIILGCAVELIHTYSLIHDDLPAMDDDDYRRGKLTCHKVFGEANAILAGDALLPLAFNIIAEKIDPKKAVHIIKELSLAVGTMGMVGGQAEDLEFQDKGADKKTQERINRLKTARLFEAATKIGAIVSSGDQKKISAMARYGSYLGTAFQIVDDIIDKEGHSKLLGLDRSHRDAKAVTEKAKSALKIFGRRADMLKELADNLLKRAK